MINSINPINSNISMASPLTSYKQAQSAANTVATMVFQSFSLLTNAQESGITNQGLNDLKTLLENENLTDGSAYKLVNTMLANFDKLSTNGESITQNDFTSVIKFAAAQSFSQTSALSSLIADGSLNISSAIAEKYGQENAQTLALIDFLDEISSDSVNKIASNLNSAGSKSTIKSDSYYGNNQIQEYTTVTKQQVTSPINIAV